MRRVMPSLSGKYSHLTMEITSCQEKSNYWQVVAGEGTSRKVVAAKQEMLVAGSKKETHSQSRRWDRAGASDTCGISDGSQQSLEHRK